MNKNAYYMHIGSGRVKKYNDLISEEDYTEDSIYEDCCDGYLVEVVKVIDPILGEQWIPQEESI